MNNNASLASRPHAALRKRRSPRPAACAGHVHRQHRRAHHHRRRGGRLSVMQGASFGFLPVVIPPAKNFGIKAVLVPAALPALPLNWILPGRRGA